MSPLISFRHQTDGRGATHDSARAAARSHVMCTTCARVLLAVVRLPVYVAIAPQATVVAITSNISRVDPNLANVFGGVGVPARATFTQHRLDAMHHWWHSGCVAWRGTAWRGVAWRDVTWRASGVACV